MIAEHALPQRLLATLSMRFGIWCGAIILTGLMVAGNAHAIKPFKPSPTELRTLPPTVLRVLAATRMSTRCGGSAWVARVFCTSTTTATD